MKTKYQRAIVFDLETGGFSPEMNSITEVAFVVVDLIEMSIIEQHSFLFKPYMDLQWTGDAVKDAKQIYKTTGAKNDMGLKVLKFKDEDITLKNISALADELDMFYDEIDNKMLIQSDIEALEAGKYRDLMEVLFNMSYTKGALKATGVTRELLESDEAENPAVNYQKIMKVIRDHTMGNVKPIMVGHNIGDLPRRIVRGKEVKPNGFDNPFLEHFFKANNGDYFDSINDFLIDTLTWSRLKFVELGSYALGSVANHLDITLEEAHRALPDAVANAKVFIKMFSHLRGQGSAKSKYKRRQFNFQM